MLDPWIIEEIQRRELERQYEEQRQQPVLELPFLEAPPTEDQAKPADTDRGIAVIDLLG